MMKRLSQIEQVEPNFVRNSQLYQEFLAEREEILKHKWLESEKQGYDIGFERALLDWIRHHRTLWRQARRRELSESACQVHEARKGEGSGFSY